MRALLRSMQPDNFEHISAVLALYRPGPMGVNATMIMPIEKINELLLNQYMKNLLNHLMKSCLILMD
jgi:DNA polymerase-3 subunit alpha